MKDIKKIPLKLLPKRILNIIDDSESFVNITKNDFINILKLEKLLFKRFLQINYVNHKSGYCYDFKIYIDSDKINSSDRASKNVDKKLL